MENNTLNRWSKYFFKNGKIANNRVVVPPMASQTASNKGYVTLKTLEHYKKLSQSGAGILFAEYSYIHTSGKGEINQLAIDSDHKIPGLTELRKSIQFSGALAGIQIVHTGGKTSSNLTGQKLLGASEISIPSKNTSLEAPRSIDQNEITKMINWYLDATKRAYLSGFDIVELHAAHGYGLNQWLSPITNQRQDLYGGSLENRARLLLEVSSKIKELYPSLLLAVRLPGQDHYENGLQSSDMQWVSKKLSHIGVDLIDISSGIGGWMRPNNIQGQGYLVQDASNIKSSLSTPVIGVGGIEKGDFIDSILLEEKVDFAAVGRAILKEPLSWGLRELNCSCEKAIV
ncbi:MAG: NADH:flavin oxidoreductase [Oligoflexia bacterium]|nr:NADH:flavin oxidoreductase [Oligoflexia bacterium]